MIKKINLLFFFTLFLLVMHSSCTKNAVVSHKGNTDIIPMPLSMNVQEGSFTLTENTEVIIPESGEEWNTAVQTLITHFSMATGRDLKVKKSSTGSKNAIHIKPDAGISHEEGYRLNVAKEGIEISAKTAKGAFYGIQTLLQLFPAGIYGNQQFENSSFEIPLVSIKDAPRFSYRGMHLDVCRHFFSLDEVKRYIDLLALHKCNYFHWHLTEDQGWRIEIKQYSKLVEQGGFRKETLVGHYNDQPHQFDGKRYGGFYTQEEVKEVIQYAAERFVTIIPEIELPGHAQAAIAAYPELGCTGEQLEVMTKWGISDNVYCPNEATFTFLENVLNEVMDLFPGEYVHIGGDECPKTKWKESEFCQNLIKEKGLKDEYGLQSYFVQRIEKMINAKGKRMIGWDEILEGGLAPNATVMSWRGVEGGILAASAGHDVIMSPTSHCYFDYYQSEHKDEPLAIGGFLPLEKVYDFEPIPEELAADKVKHVLGPQANLWTEYIATSEKLDYMTYPRASALAEVGWSGRGRKNFGDFVKRLGTHFQRFEAYGVKAAVSVYDLAADCNADKGTVKVDLSSNIPGMKITYTLDGSAPTPESTAYQAPFDITSNSQLRAASFSNGTSKGRTLARDIKMHKAVGRLVRLNHEPAARYAAGGHGAIFNGIRGSDERYGDKEWLGFSGKDLEALLDLGEPTVVNEVKCRFFNGNGQWIYLPKKVVVKCSNDGKDSFVAGSVEKIKAEGKIAEVTIKLASPEPVRYLEIFAERQGLIPDGAQGAGHEAWLFVDEIEVN